MTEKRKPASWARYLNDPDAEYTLEEYRAAVAARALGHLENIDAALTHLEGMVGALDTAAALQAQAEGRFYPASQKIRAALDEHRDALRAAAYAEREKALGRGE